MSRVAIPSRRQVRQLTPDEPIGVFDRSGQRVLVTPNIRVVAVHDRGETLEISRVDAAVTTPVRVSRRALRFHEGVVSVDRHVLHKNQAAARIPAHLLPAVGDPVVIYTPLVSTGLKDDRYEIVWRRDQPRPPMVEVTLPNDGLVGVQEYGICVESGILDGAFDATGFGDELPFRPNGLEWIPFEETLRGWKIVAIHDEATFTVRHPKGWEITSQISSRTADGLLRIAIDNRDHDLTHPVSFRVPTENVTVAPGTQISEQGDPSRRWTVVGNAGEYLVTQREDEQIVIHHRRIRVTDDDFLFYHGDREQHEPLITNVLKWHQGLSERRVGIVPQGDRSAEPIRYAEIIRTVDDRAVLRVDDREVSVPMSDFFLRDGQPRVSQFSIENEIAFQLRMRERDETFIGWIPGLFTEAIRRALTEAHGDGFNATPMVHPVTGGLVESYVPPDILESQPHQTAIEAQFQDRFGYVHGTPEEQWVHSVYAEILGAAESPDFPVLDEYEFQALVGEGEHLLRLSDPEGHIWFFEPFDWIGASIRFGDGPPDPLSRHWDAMRGPEGRHRVSIRPIQDVQAGWISEQFGLDVAPHARFGIYKGFVGSFYPHADGARPGSFAHKSPEEAAPFCEPGNEFYPLMCAVSDYLLLVSHPDPGIYNLLVDDSSPTPACRYIDAGGILKEVLPTAFGSFAPGAEARFPFSGMAVGQVHPEALRRILLTDEGEGLISPDRLASTIEVQPRLTIPLFTRAQAQLLCFNARVLREVIRIQDR